MGPHLDRIFQDIQNQIRAAKAKIPPPWIAAFDADGTLWDIDLGELFFDYEIHHCNLSLPADPWGYYHRTKEVDTPKAYLWLAQINAGQKLSTVRNWAEKAFLSFNPYPFLSFQRRLIEFLHSEEFEVYVVTASVKWAVEPGARRLGIPEGHVLGVTTKLNGEIVGAEQSGHITWRDGKAKALLEATNGVRPLLAAGNTTGDTALIESSQLIKIAVQSQKSDEPLFSTEQELQSVATERGWITLDLSYEW